MTDLEYRKVIIGLIGIAITLLATLIISLLFDISLSSKELWLGAFIIYSSFFAIYTTPLTGKIISLLIAFLIISVYLINIVGWPVGSSIISALVTVILLSSMFMIS